MQKKRQHFTAYLIRIKSTRPVEQVGTQNWKKDLEELQKQIITT